MSFTIFIDDNFHYQDESERYEQGVYESYEAAVIACKLIVDQYLADTFREGMKSAELYKSYISFGEDPFIVPDSEGAAFSAWDYAKQLCSEMCDTA